MTVVSLILYWYTSMGLALTMAITFGTTAYHFVMRLGVGTAIHWLLHNRVNYRARWFAVSDLELSLYRKLKVKQWKDSMPTYDPSAFDPSLHSWDEIAQAMCQSELVHEVIVVFSFVPILASIPFGELPVFLLTSIAAAVFDMMFVIMQRYNRSRIMRILKKHGTKSI